MSRQSNQSHLADPVMSISAFPPYSTTIYKVPFVKQSASSGVRMVKTKKGVQTNECRGIYEARRVLQTRKTEAAAKDGDLEKLRMEMQRSVFRRSRPPCRSNRTAQPSRLNSVCLHQGLNTLHSSSLLGSESSDAHIEVPAMSDQRTQQLLLKLRCVLQVPKREHALPKWVSSMRSRSCSSQSVHRAKAFEIRSIA